MAPITSQLRPPHTPFTISSQILGHFSIRGRKTLLVFLRYLLRSKVPLLVRFPLRSLSILIDYFHGIEGVSFAGMQLFSDVQCGFRRLPLGSLTTRWVLVSFITLIFRIVSVEEREGFLGFFFCFLFLALKFNISSKRVGERFLRPLLIFDHSMFPISRWPTAVSFTG